MWATSPLRGADDTGSAGVGEPPECQILELMMTFEPQEEEDARILHQRPPVSELCQAGIKALSLPWMRAAALRGALRNDGDEFDGLIAKIFPGVARTRGPADFSRMVGTLSASCHLEGSSSGAPP